MACLYERIVGVFSNYRQKLIRINRKYDRYHTLRSKIVITFREISSSLNTTQMLRYGFVFLLLIHGLIHVLGFLKAFQISEVSQLTQPISKPLGMLWLAAMLLFLATAVFFLQGNGYWPILAFTAIGLSQVLILTAWQDARFGTIANLIILVVAIVGYGSWRFEESFRKDVRESLARTNTQQSELLTESDLSHLPAPLQRYIRYAGAVGQPKVKNVRIVFEGQMREKGKDWFDFTSEQYNFYDEEPTRLFFMKARIKGLPTVGYHRYKGNRSGMHIRLLSLFPVVDLEGEEMFRSETVTLFNDMCLFAPAALIDGRIQWEAVDETSAKATFTNKGVSISATLFFNDKGELVDFVSDDRSARTATGMENLRFSTPAGEYHTYNGYRLTSYGEAVYHYPDGKFSYGVFNTKRVEYNVSELK